MRILFICNEYPPAVHGGIGVFVSSLAEVLASFGHDVGVVGFASHLRARSEGIEKGVGVVRLPWPRRLVGFRAGRFRLDSSALASRRMLSREAARVAAEFRPDVVESHDWSGPLWGVPWRPLVVRLHGASSVLATSRGGRVSRLMRWMERRNVGMADRVASVSDFIGRSTMAALGLDGTSFSTLYHGIDAELFRPENPEARLREVLFAGTVKKLKGIHDLLRAIPGILTSAPDARFTVVGRYPEEASDPCSPSVLLQAHGLTGSVASRISFLGQVPRRELPHFYSRAAVAVFPSHSEAFGLACAEAMACGAAVVMTTRGSGPELVEDGRSGLLVDPADAGALGRAVSRLLGNARLRGQLGEAARSRVLEKFNLADSASRNIAFYERVVRRFGERRDRTYV